MITTKLIGCITTTKTTTAKTYFIFAIGHPEDDVVGIGVAVIVLINNGSKVKVMGREELLVGDAQSAVTQTSNHLNLQCYHK
jgi:hypothetical protein